MALEWSSSKTSWIPCRSRILEAVRLEQAKPRAMLGGRGHVFVCCKHFFRIASSIQIDYLRNANE